MKPESPINALPPVVIALSLLIILIEVVFQLAEHGLIGGPRGVGWRISAVEEYGFSPAVLDLILVRRLEEHTSELQSPVPTSYAVFCLKKKKNHSTWYHLDFSLLHYTAIDFLVVVFLSL